MTLTLDVEHADETATLQILGPDDLGDEATPSLQTARIERSLLRQPDETDTAEVTVYRDAWTDVEANLDRSNDRFVIRDDGEIVFGGRLADFERDGVLVSVLLDGPKRDAIDAEPSGGNDVFAPQPDSTLVTDELLPRVPTVSTGTIETVDDAIGFSESHAAPGKSLTKLGRDADAELRYRTTEDDFLLDYVGRLGEDRTDETLSPASATVIAEPRIREQITEEVTHVRVLGAGEGTAQVQAEAVVDGFDAAEDRPIYRQRVDKDIQDADRAQALAETLVDEYDGEPEYLEVEAELPRQVAPAVGDEFAVELPAHGVDTTLRVTVAERIVDSDGDRYRVELSNRRHTAALQGDERALELDSLSEGNAGQYYALADGEGWDAVDDNEPYEFSFYRPPDTIGELRAVLRLESRPYRLRAAQAGHDHSVSISDHNHDVSLSDHDHDVSLPDHNHSVDIGVTSASNDDFEALSTTENTAAITDLDEFNEVTDTFSVGDVDTSEVVVGASLRARYEGPRQDSNIDFVFRAFIENIDSGYSEFMGNYRFAIDADHDPVGDVPIVNRKANFLFAVDPTNCRNETLQLRFEPLGKEDPDDIGGDTLFSVLSKWFAVGRHTHDVDATTTTSDGGGVETTTADGGGVETTTADGGGTTTTTSSTAAVDPGIVEQTDETVSGVDVTVAGETVATGLGHPIDESIDIEQVLSDGRNDIEITSDSLGELRATVEYEAIKNASRD